MTRVFITGTAGFIGYHLADQLLRAGVEVHGYDGMSDYYDVALKRSRHDLLAKHAGFTATEALVEDAPALSAAMARCRPDVVVHLAAQAGVRYSIENPRAYLEANVVGSFNVMEAALEQKVDHLLMASTSSAYGANTEMPYRETQKADMQMSFYAATKKATESMGHSWAHIHGMPVTMFRFFTVYGPWGRPDMALFKFTDAVLADRPIDVYNNGEMFRDFTYIDDLVRGIIGLIETPPPRPDQRSGVAAIPGDSLSDVAPFRVVNIGNSTKVRLMDYIAAIEEATGKTAQLNMMPMQPGDVPATWADASLLKALTGYAPQTGITEGVARFVEWFRAYYGR